MWRVVLGIFVGGGLPAIIALFLPRKKVYALGEKLGIMASRLLRQKLGKPGENAIETTMIDFASGLMDGLRKDNERKVKSLQNNG